MTIFLHIFSHKLEPRNRHVSAEAGVLNKYSRTITQIPSAGAAQAQCKSYRKEIMYIKAI